MVHIFFLRNLGPYQAESRHKTEAVPRFCQGFVFIASMSLLSTGETQRNQTVPPQPEVNFSAVKRSIGFTISFENHGEGPSSAY